MIKTLTQLKGREIVLFLFQVSGYQQIVVQNIKDIKF